MRLVEKKPRRYDLAGNTKRFVVDVPGPGGCILDHPFFPNTAKVGQMQAGFQGLPFSALKDAGPAPLLLFGA